MKNQVIFLLLLLLCITMASCDAVDEPEYYSTASEIGEFTITADVGIRYYDENNDPVMIKAGYAQLKRELDSKNRIIREEYYDAESKPVLLPQGYAANEREYDDNNNAIIQRYYNAEGDLVVTTWNYAEVHRDYDEEHRVMAEYYYGKDGHAFLQKASDPERGQGRVPGQQRNRRAQGRAR